MAETLIQKARKALRKHIETKGHGEAIRIARLCDVDPSLPGKWWKGKCTPEADGGSREVLEREANIPASWWKTKKKTRRDGRLSCESSP